MISLADYQALDKNARRIFTLFVVWPELLDINRILQVANTQPEHLLVQGTVIRVVREFSRKGWIASPKGLKTKRLRLQQPLVRAAYEAVVADGDANGWWPTVETAGVHGKPDLFPELHRKPSVPAKPSVEMLIGEGVRLFAKGSGRDASSAFMNRLHGPDCENLFRSVGFCVAERFAEEPALQFVPNDPLLVFLPYAMNMAFLLGRPVTRALDEVARLIAQHETGGFTKKLLLMYVALCAWTRPARLLNEKEPVHGGPFERGCRAFAAGDLAEAERLFKQDDVNEEVGRNVFRDENNIPQRFLMAMVAALCKCGKVAKSRPANLMHGRFGYSTYWSSYAFPGEMYMHRVTEASDAATPAWLTVHMRQGALLKERRDNGGILPDDFLHRLLLAWDWYMMMAGRAQYRELASGLMPWVRELAKNGWMTLARLLTALLAGTYNEAEEAILLKAVDAGGGLLLPRVEPEPEWKGVLAELGKAVDKSTKSAALKSNAQVVWYLNLERVGETRYYKLAGLTRAYRPVGGPEDGSRDETFDHYCQDIPKRLRGVMSKQDMLIEAAAYSEDSHTPNGRGKLFQCLAEATNLAIRPRHYDSWGTDDYVYGEATPAKIVCEPYTLTTTVNEDGGMSISAPSIALDADDATPYLEKRAEGEYVFTDMSEAGRNILKVFHKFGKDGTIVIPREGMAQAEQFLSNVTAVLPLAEATAVNAEKMPHVTAAAAIRVRLDYTENILTVRAVVLPIAENPNLVLEPGMGAVEKVVAGAAGAFILVRDLAAEQAAFASVSTLLADDESAFDGRATWRFEDLAAALAALAKLKAATPPIPLEWTCDRHLNVTSMPVSGVKLTSQRTADDWFHVDGNFQLDDGRVMGIVALLEAARSRKGQYVRLSDGDYLALSKTMARELDALNAAGRRKGDGIEIVKAALPMLDDNFGGAGEIALPDAMAVTAAEIRSAFARRPSVPNTLQAELRPYQLEGYKWLSRLAACGFGACLADDMGLGKTLQVIALLLERASSGPSLVIAPSSVCGNWRRELQRFAPTLNPVMALEETTALPETHDGDVVISSYGYLLFHADDFAGVTWNGLVLDEAQAIKNDASKRAKTVKTLHARFRVAATGTPVENRLGELWSLFDFLNPGLLGPATSFVQRFTAADGKATPALKRLVKPLILRRLKTDVLDDLPEKTEITIPVVLGPDERSAYEGCRQHALAQLAAKGGEEGGANRMSILAELTRLRRFCCHPSLVVPGLGVPSAKMEALVELLEGLHEGHHRALVFSQFTDYLAIVQKMLAAHGWTHLYLDGATPTLEREKLVNAFQGGTGDFFLISLKAGGTGLNLTAANYVILLDPWWNPAVENQAADRAHRIGQKNPVTVYRLIASDTVEARVVELHHEKLAIAEDVLDGTGSAALSPAQLMKLFA